jgi:DNA-binding response OmpR family regulator
MDPRILIIDDDITMSELLKALLSLDGFEAETLEVSGELTEMVKAVKNIQPDLILCDVNLRDLDGFDLLRLLRKQPELNQTCVLMSSGMDFSHKCYQEEADGFILKPYMPDDLVHKIHNLLSAKPDQIE